MDKVTAMEALRAIAEARKSHMLLSFLETGTVYDLDIPAAYARLGIEDHSVDDEVVITTFSVRVSI
jgi:ubiquitin carboxyl-terminal hydrolase 25/28